MAKNINCGLGGSEASTSIYDAQLFKNNFELKIVVCNLHLITEFQDPINSTHREVKINKYDFSAVSDQSPTVALQESLALTTLDAYYVCAVNGKQTYFSACGNTNIPVLDNITKEVEYKTDQNQIRLAIFYQNQSFFTLKQPGNSFFSIRNNINLPQSFYQCFSFDNLGQNIYTISSTDKLHVINIQTQAVVSTSIAGLPSNIQDCYYSNTTNSLVLVTLSNGQFGFTELNLQSHHLHTLPSGNYSTYYHRNIFPYVVNYEQQTGALHITSIFNSTCPSWSYYDSGTNNCLQCGSDCQVCTSSTVCTTCVAGFYVSVGNCVTCSDANCDSCAGDICSTCSGSYSLSNGVCTNQTLFCSGRQIVNNREVCSNIINDPIMRTIVSSAKLVLSTPGTRGMTRILTTFFCFNDEYLLYYFHNRNYKQVQISSTFVAIIYEINKERFIPFQSEALFFLSSQVDHLFSNKSVYANENKYIQNEEPVNFFQNINEILFWYLPAVLVITLLLKMFAIIIDRCSEKIEGEAPSLSQRFASYLSTLSSIWILLINIIEAQLIIITFQGIRQLNVPLSFNIWDKLNFFFAMNFLFVCLLYSLIFYPFCFYYGKQIREDIMEVKDKKRFSFYNEFQRQVLKGFCLGMAQGFFLNNFFVMISLLILIRTINFFMIFKSCKIEDSKLIFGINVLNGFFGVVFDLLMLLSYLCYEEKVQHWAIKMILSAHSYTEAVLILGIIFLSLLAILARLISSIKEFCTAKNKVVPLVIAKNKFQISSALTKLLEQNKQAIAKQSGKKDGFFLSLMDGDKVLKTMQIPNTLSHKFTLHQDHKDSKKNKNLLSPSPKKENKVNFPQYILERQSKSFKKSKVKQAKDEKNNPNILYVKKAQRIFAQYEEQKLAEKVSRFAPSRQ